MNSGCRIQNAESRIQNPKSVNKRSPFRVLHSVFGILYSVFCILFLLASCAGSTRPMVKIGLIAPFEELYRADGYAALHAVRLAIAERNAAGGVAGRNVLLVALDDSGRPQQAALQAGKLAADADVLGVVGPLQETTASAAGPELGKNHVPWITPLPLEPEQRPGGFSLFASPWAVSQKAAEAVAAQAGGASSSVVVFSDQAAAISQTARLHLPTSAADVDVKSWPLAAAQPLQMERLSAPDGILWMGDAAGAANLALALSAALSDDIALVGGPEVGSPVFAGRAGPAAAGVHWLSSGAPAANLPSSFVSAYRRLAGSDPGPQAVLAYDAANLLLDAIEQACGDVSRQPCQGEAGRLAVRQALWDLDKGQKTMMSGQLDWDKDGYWRDAPLHWLGVTSHAQ